MRKSFTLIEVMIAVMIIFIVVSAVMDIMANNRHLTHLILKARNFALRASVAFIEKGSGSNYDRVREFNIKNDKVIHILKRDKIYLEKTEDTSEDYNFSNLDFTQKIYKLKAYNKHNSIINYSIGIQ